MGEILSEELLSVGGMVVDKGVGKIELNCEDLRVEELRDEKGLVVSREVRETIGDDTKEQFNNCGSAYNYMFDISGIKNRCMSLKGRGNKLGLERFNNPTEMALLINGYFKKQSKKKLDKHMATKDEVATISEINKYPLTLIGLCNFLGIGMNKFRKVYLNMTLEKQRESVDNQLYYEIATLANQSINENLMEGALMGKWNSSISKLLLANFDDNVKSEKQIDSENGLGLDSGAKTINVIQFGNREDLLKYQKEKERLENEREILDGEEVE